LHVKIHLFFYQQNIKQTNIQLFNSTHLHIVIVIEEDHTSQTYIIRSVFEAARLALPTNVYDFKQVHRNTHTHVSPSSTRLCIIFVHLAFSNVQHLSASGTENRENSTNKSWADPV